MSSQEPANYKPQLWLRHRALTPVGRGKIKGNGRRLCKGRAAERLPGGACGRPEGMSECTPVKSPSEERAALPSCPARVRSRPVRGPYHGSSSEPAGAPAWPVLTAAAPSGWAEPPECHGPVFSGLRVLRLPPAMTAPKGDAGNANGKMGTRRI